MPHIIISVLLHPICFLLSYALVNDFTKQNIHEQIYHKLEQLTEICDLYFFSAWISKLASSFSTSHPGFINKNKTNNSNQKHVIHSRDTSSDGLFFMTFNTSSIVWSSSSSSSLIKYSGSSEGIKRGLTMQIKVEKKKHSYLPRDSDGFLVFLSLFLLSALDIISFISSVISFPVKLFPESVIYEYSSLLWKPSKLSSVSVVFVFNALRSNVAPVSPILLSIDLCIFLQKLLIHWKVSFVLTVQIEFYKCSVGFQCFTQRSNSRSSDVVPCCCE